VSVTIRYDRRAAYTYAFAILAEAWNELVQGGVTPDGVGVPPLQPDTEVLYAISKDGDIVGVLTWDHNKQENAYEVTLAYVEPSSRRRGVFRELFNALCERAYTNGVLRVVSKVPVSSPSAIEAFSRVGGNKTAITYEHAVT